MCDDFEESVGMDAEESLLYSARHGEVLVVKSMLEAKKEGKLTLDINCKGRTKGNLGWTPLHLATYFGHVEVVRTLLQAGADIDAVNDTGDTPLHKACFIGNEDLVTLLLTHNADVYIMNGVGSTPASVCATKAVRRLVEGAEKAERVRGENELLSAVRDANLPKIQKLLTQPNPPNINCVDSQGNCCLHIAAYRGHPQVAVLLLQNGINTLLRNNYGQTAIDLSRDDEMRQVLSVRPVQKLRRTAATFEGPLLKRSRFLGWRPIWAVLQRGVLLYFGSRAEASRINSKWRSKQYLDGATLSAPDTEPALIIIKFSDGETHRLSVQGEDIVALRQAWVTSLSEHISYSGHYLWAGANVQENRESEQSLDDSKPLGSMQDALTAATNSLALLDTQLKECAAIIAALEKSVNVNNSLHMSAYMRFQHASGSGASALSSLRHCAALVQQARDADKHRLQIEIERNRVLEEALAALARTHHALEMSVAEELTKSKRKKISSSIRSESKENFFDVFDDGDSDDDTLITAGLSSPLGALSPFGSINESQFDAFDGDKTPTNDRPLSGGSLSPATSMGTLVSSGGHVYRNARRHISGTPSSQWSI